MCIALTIQYDGSAYCGFQIQPKQPSIQEQLEKAIATIYQKNIRVHCAGRTDSGVHAYAQVVHFTIEVPKELQRFMYSLNCLLPKDISVIHGEIVDDTFHARFSCTERQYVYRILNSPFRMAHYEKRRYWVRQQLNVDKMKKAAAHLVGQHDFASFTRTSYFKKNETTIRRIDAIRFFTKPNMVDVFFRGSGFLHNMIRIISGSLVAVGKGEINADDVLTMLLAKNRKLSGTTLPPHPLYFVNALYENYRTPPAMIPFYHEHSDEVI